ncbi:histidine kinase [Salinimicrobium sp. GXAS 041]|uniref:helix-turn-helix and ligand-binding sensor domain-containing protein n=1 Tax=Salinimicrobium sp. GXAS 041 TaxID=3400806 RepID=UPI003C71D515
MTNKIFYTLFICMLSVVVSTAQRLSPPIQNYSSVEYGAASQNWDIGVSEQGVIFSANNQGLLSFDGQRWELHALESGSIIRSVYPHKDRVYTGAYKEFGYWKKDGKGNMEYTSLIPLLGEYELQSEEFWEILSYRDAIYFRSFGAIYRYEENTIVPVANLLVNEMTVFNDKILVAVGRRGLHYLEEDGSLVPLPNQELIVGKAILDLQVHENKMLIGTRDGLFVFEQNEFQPYGDEALNEMLRQFELNEILEISGDELIIGTVKNGVLHYFENTGLLRTYNRNNGLQNNTVLAMNYEKGRVWLGLDNGIDVINMDSPISFYTDDTGELGSVYDLSFYRKELFLASNTGVYKLTDDNLELLEGAEGHAWNLKLEDNILYANHNTGTYIVTQDAFQPVDKRTGSFEITRFRNNKFLIANYTGIDLYDKNAGEVRLLNGVRFPVKQILQENPTTIWATDAYEGVYRIGISETGDSLTSVKKMFTEEGGKDYNARIHKVSNEIVVASNGRWYRYNSFRDSLEVLTEWERYSGYRLLEEENGLFWFVNSKSNTLIITNFNGSEVSIPSKLLGDRTVKKNERVLKVRDSVYYITLHDGFARIDLQRLYKSAQEEEVIAPLVQRLADSEHEYDLEETPHISRKNAKEVAFSAGLPVSDAVSLTYELHGTDSKMVSGEVDDGIIRFQNLPHDDYVLKLNALNSQGKPAASTEFKFVVDPPWYLKNGMKFLYVLLLLGLIGLVFWINKLKLQKHRRLLKERYAREHEERINAMEKEKLINEINLKRKELANSTMVAAKKNEVLMEIQGELNKDREKFSNQFRVKHIMNKINKAVKNKDEWKVFETNFNELHEDFFKDLLAAYPSLSSKDLKLCSYLKMNLTSKEIAPLMGISVRGVEVHRYRLRKKIDLDGKESLTNFLITNF